MALSAGTRLGSYEILAPLGAGGMGEVYRGRDTKLGRDVAIKVLPAEVEQGYEVPRRTLIRVTLDPAADLWAIWSPDGDRVFILVGASPTRPRAYSHSMMTHKMARCESCYDSPIPSSCWLSLPGVGRLFSSSPGTPTGASLPRRASPTPGREVRPGSGTRSRPPLPSAGRRG